LVLEGNSAIVLNGTNSIKSTFKGSGDSIGVYTNYNLTIQGSGSLTVTSEAVQGSMGISVGGNLNIQNGARVTANAVNAKDNSLGIGVWGSNFTISGSATNVTATSGTASDGSLGIQVHPGSLTINGATVSATAGAAKFSFGINVENNVSIENGARVTANGRNANNYSMGIASKGSNFTISGSATNVTANAGTAGDGSTGIQVESGNLTINGATVNATAGAAEESFGITVSEALTIENGARVTANTGNAKDRNGGIVVWRGDFDIYDSARVTATARSASEAGGYSGGIILFEGDFHICGPVTTTVVTATGGTAADGWSSGIVALEGSLTINGATINATAGASKKSFGIFAEDLILTNFNGTITMSGNNGALEGVFVVPMGVNYSVSQNINGNNASAPKASNGSDTLPSGRWARFTK
jgi:hypothetical protein